MPSPLDRLRRRPGRDAPDEEPTATPDGEASAAPPPDGDEPTRVSSVPAATAGDAGAGDASGDPVTRIQPTPPPFAPGAGAGAAPTGAQEATAAPAGEEPEPADLVPSRPGVRERGPLRRRLRYLRRVRELGYRDLGGLVFEQRRAGVTNDALVDAKARALARLDRELRAIEAALHDERPVQELREAGVSLCARCGALMSSDANYCGVCGTPVGAPAAMAPPAGPGQPVVAHAYANPPTGVHTPPPGGTPDGRPRAAATPAPGKTPAPGAASPAGAPATAPAPVATGAPADPPSGTSAGGAPSPGDGPTPEPPSFAKPLRADAEPEAGASDDPEGSAR